MTGPEADRGVVIREYLLGGLTPAQREEIDERLLSEPDFHGDVGATQDDLIHAYLADELAQPDRARFESYFLASPRRQERVAFMRSLVAAADAVRTGRAHTAATPRPTRPPRLGTALPWAAVLVVGLAGGGWSLRERSLREREAAAARENEATLREEIATQERLARELRSGTGDIAVWPLDAGAERGAGTAGSFTLDRPWIRLRVPLERVPRRAQYRASLQDVNGREIAAFEGLEQTAGPNGPALDVIVPAGLLRRGAYLVSVQEVASPHEELTAAPFEVR